MPLAIPTKWGMIYLGITINLADRRSPVFPIQIRTGNAGELNGSGSGSQQGSGAPLVGLDESKKTTAAERSVRPWAYCAWIERKADLMVRLLVIDDHEVVRRGLAALLTDTDINIVAEVSSADLAVEQVRQTLPDVVLLDVRMGGHAGLDVLIQIKEQFVDKPVVMFSAHDNPTYVARSVALGATDFVLKSEARHVLLDAIRRAASGVEPATTSVFRQIRTIMNRRREESTDDLPLTNRELQVLRHVALGLSNREIGLSLGISVETVKEHVQNILRKTNVGDRTQAAVWAVRRGLV